MDAINLKLRFAPLRVWLKRVVGKLLFTSFLLADENGRRYAVTVNRFGKAQARVESYSRYVRSEWCPSPKLKGEAFEKFLQ